MKPWEVVEVVKRIELRGGLSLLRAIIDAVQVDERFVEIRAQIVVPQRDARLVQDESGLILSSVHRDVTIQMPLLVAADDFATPASVFAKCFSHLRALIKHETQEGFIADGERLYDPHKEPLR